MQSTKYEPYIFEAKLLVQISQITLLLFSYIPA